MRVFKEVQRFNQWWMQLVHLSMLLLLGYLCYSWYFSSHAAEVLTPGLTIQFLVFASVGLTLLLLLILKLETKIDERGIHYRFVPFQRHMKLIPWETIETCELRTYNPIREYGGWGYRTSFGKGKAYNVKGNKGIQITFKNGHKLLIGTQKMQEAARVIARYSHNNSNN